MTVLTSFGLFAVTAMLVTYSLEHRSRRFILAFAGACLLGSLYGFLQGAWPFGVVEAIWALVALHRWNQSRRSASERQANVDAPALAGGEPLACIAGAIPEADRPKHFALMRSLFGTRLLNQEERTNGMSFEFRLADLEDLVRFVANERRCCPFLRFELVVPPNAERITLALTGPDRTAAFLLEEFQLQTV